VYNIDNDVIDNVQQVTDLRVCVDSQSALQLESLELRRVRCDLTFAYKLIFGFVDTDLSTLFQLRESSNTPGHRYKPLLSSCSTSVRHQLFAVRVAKIWNSLLLDSIDFSGVKRFKSSLNNDIFGQVLSCLLFLV